MSCRTQSAQHLSMTTQHGNADAKAQQPGSQLACCSHDAQVVIQQRQRPHMSGGAAHHFEDGGVKGWRLLWPLLKTPAGHSASSSGATGLWKWSPKGLCRQRQSFSMQWQCL